MSSVSRATARRFSGGIDASVRMLCVRSASLTMMTRMSRTIARIILRKLSACASLRLLNWTWSSLVTPSTISATSLPNFCSTSAIEEGVSSTTSCRIAAAIVAPSRCRSARMSATAIGWVMKASPDLRFWPLCAASAYSKASRTRSTWSGGR